MEAKDLLTQVRESVTVKRVFGDPYEKNGVTVIPAATVTGGGGQGEGEGTGPDGTGGKGTGGGFGVNARPSGVYVISGNEVEWRPAMDMNRVILGGQIVAVVFLLTIRSIVKARAKAREVEVLTAG
jgi:uncharacterized spore protein YtfJ